MSTSKRLPPIDQPERERALDLQRSVIVQAPAGSGKTELLVQRYLALLGVVGTPEEVLAITFTRKAAAEMRNRVLDALSVVVQEPAALQPETRDLAKRAVEHGTTRRWNLLTHPARLRILTIDALNGVLARRMPLSSGAGATLPVNPFPEPLYREAARRTLARLDDEDETARAVERLVVHLDTNVARVEQLLSAMLARRAHWLPHIVRTRSMSDRRQGLEDALAHLVDDDLRRLCAAISASAEREIVALVSNAAETLAGLGRGSPITACEGLESLPSHADEGALEVWRGVAELLLTKTGQWRRSANANIGLPPTNPEHRRRFSELLAELGQEDTLRRQLHEVRRLPAPYYEESQWTILETLLELLALTAAELELVFRDRGEVDYSAVAQAALAALGSPESPTDQALAMDYRIQHILVDEFQDTSVAQYALLEMLTAGWQEGDGRTLFCVGDPMQSIYRFRDAEVGLFLRAQRKGIGNIMLDNVRLEVNFRSQAGIVHWVNQTFRRLFPAQANMAIGGVTYSNTAPHRTELPGVPVVVHPAVEGDDMIEAELVTNLVQRALVEDPEGTIGVLVSSRKHLDRIFECLRAAGCHFQAIEIEKLAERSTIQDLVALTRAVSHLGDRTSWLAVLRAPWCGLTLEDLARLTADDRHSAIWDLMQDSERAAKLSQDGQNRLSRVTAILERSLSERGKVGLRRLVEGTWLALGGPATVTSATDLADGESFLRLLDDSDVAGDIPADLERRLGDLFAAPDVDATESVQLMTIHRAKGLEFDTVILPGLGKKTGLEGQQLLRWLEVVRPRRGSDWVLAPLEASGRDRDPLHAYLKRQDRRRDDYERTRLLYVATTRARKRLHLLGQLPEAEEDEPVSAPARGSLLADLWPAVKEQFEASYLSAAENVQRRRPVLGRRGIALRRLPAEWRPPEPTPALSGVLAESDSAIEDRESIRFDWAGEVGRHVGTVVHWELQQIAEEGPEGWNGMRVAERRPRYTRRLFELGVPQRAIDNAVARVHAALERTLTDPRGRWILADEHRSAKSEWTLTGRVDNQIRSIVIDRSFVDDRDVRWIIDYKTSTHEGGALESFLDNEVARYRYQLETYARLVRALEPERQLRVALYFPLLGGWREWEPSRS